MTHDPSSLPLILVVDGSKTRLKIIDIALQRQGYQVKAIQDPVQGYRDLFAPVPTCTPVLLIVGDRFPTISGLAVVRTVRRRARYHTLPIITIGPRQIAHLLFAKLAGATDYLTAPFTVAELRAMVHRHVPPVSTPEH